MPAVESDASRLVGGSEADRWRVLERVHEYLKANASFDWRQLQDIWSGVPEAVFFNLNGHTYKGREHWTRLWQFYQPNVSSGYWTPFDLGGVVSNDLAGSRELLLRAGVLRRPGDRSLLIALAGGGGEAAVNRLVKTGLLMEIREPGPGRGWSLRCRVHPSVSRLAEERFERIDDLHREGHQLAGDHLEKEIRSSEFLGGQRRSRLPSSRVRRSRSRVRSDQALGPSASGSQQYPGIARHSG